MTFTIDKGKLEGRWRPLYFWTYRWFWPLRKKHLIVEFSFSDLPDLPTELGVIHRLFGIQLSKENEFGIAFTATSFDPRGKAHSWGVTPYIKEGKKWYFGLKDQTDKDRDPFHQIFVNLRPHETCKAIINAVDSTTFEIQFYQEGEPRNTRIRHRFKYTGILWAGIWPQLMKSYDFNIHINLKIFRQ